MSAMERTQNTRPDLLEATGEWTSATWCGDDAACTSIERTGAGSVCSEESWCTSNESDGCSADLQRIAGIAQDLYLKIKRKMFIYICQEQLF